MDHWLHMFMIPWHLHLQNSTWKSKALCPNASVCHQILNWKNPTVHKSYKNNQQNADQNTK